MFDIRNRFFKKKYHNVSAVIQRSDNVYELLERCSEDVWLVSYFLKGSFGNFLVGLPKKWQHFDHVFRSSGGIAYALPTEVSWRGCDQTLFAKYGPSWICGSDQVFWKHVPNVCPAMPIPSLKRLRQSSQGMTSDWDGEFKQEKFSTARGENDHETLDFSRLKTGRTTAQLKSIEQRPHEQASSLNRVCSELGLVTYHREGSNFLVCFEDVFFESHDQDFLGPAERKALTGALKKLGASQISGQKWQKGGLTFNMPGAKRNLMTSTIEGFGFNQHEIWVVTATQYALHLMQHLQLSERAVFEELRLLVGSLPVNLDKIFVLGKSDPQFHLSAVMRGELNAAQAPTLEHFRKFRVNALKGKCRKSLCDSSCETL